MQHMHVCFLFHLKSVLKMANWTFKNYIFEKSGEVVKSSAKYKV